MISSITRCGPLALRALTLSLTSTTLSPSLMTPMRSSLNRRIFNGIPSPAKMWAYLCDNGWGLSNRMRHPIVDRAFQIGAVVVSQFEEGFMLLVNNQEVEK